MDTTDLSDPLKARDVERTRLHELAESQRWVHHAVGAVGGEAATSELNRPITPRSRAERLAGAGLRVDSRIFGGPAYQLTARQPIQPSPEGYLVAWNATVYLPFDDTIVWEVPREHTSAPLRGADFFFADSPREPAVVSLTLTAKAWPGAVGQVSVIVYRNAITARIPIFEYPAHHTVDVAVPSRGGEPPPGGEALEVTMVIEAGVEVLTFHSLAFRAGLVLDGVIEPG
jgi:hypothetical protein